MRASISAWLSGESLGRSAACGGVAGGAAGGMAWAAGVASAAAGATDATAEAMAARRANSRREIRPTLAELGLEVSSIKNLRLRPRAGRRRLLKARLRVNSASRGVEAKRQRRNSSVNRKVIRKNMKTKGRANWVCHKHREI